MDALWAGGLPPKSSSVIKCHRSYLETRCIERGYSLEEVIACVVAKDGDYWKIDTEHPAYPRVSRIAEQQQPSSAAARGPGTELKKLLAGWPFYITSSPDCSCNRVAREMDIWGADECEKPDRVDYILAAMRENAEKRGLPFIDAAGRFLIKRAIKNARKNKTLTS
jgi:hypothetical protein